MGMAYTQILRGKSAVCNQVNEKTRLFFIRRNACNKLINKGCKYIDHKCVYRDYKYQPRYGVSYGGKSKVLRRKKKQKQRNTRKKCCKQKT